MTSWHWNAFPITGSFCGLTTQFRMVDKWWRHQMESFSALLALCAGNSSVTGEFPNKGQWPGALMFSFICAWKITWVNNREAGDLRRHCAHCEVKAMKHHCGELKTKFKMAEEISLYLAVSSRSLSSRKPGTLFPKMASNELIDFFTKFKQNMWAF